MPVIRSKRTARVLIPLVALFTFASHATAANVWTAELDVEEALDAYTVRIVAANEEDCLAQMSMYRGAVVTQPCHPSPTVSAITDDKDDKRTSKTPRPKDPIDTNWGTGAGAGGGAAGSGVGHAGSGVGGGG